MKIALELEQTWDTSKKLLEYLRLLSRTMERICEMEADSPTDWFLDVKRIDEGDFEVKLTHL